MAGCIFDSSCSLLNANFESKMVNNRYLRCLFGHKKIIVEIMRSSFIGSLTKIIDKEGGPAVPNSMYSHRPTLIMTTHPLLKAVDTIGNYSK